MNSIKGIAELHRIENELVKENLIRTLYHIAGKATEQYADIADYILDREKNLLLKFDASVCRQCYE